MKGQLKKKQVIYFVNVTVVQKVLNQFSCFIHQNNPTYTRYLDNYLINCNVKGTNGCQKSYEIFHVYYVFYSGFMCQSTVIFGITKDESLVLTTLASWNCFICRNLFQNDTQDMSKCLTCETAFC